MSTLEHATKKEARGNIHPCKIFSIVLQVATLAAVLLVLTQKYPAVDTPHPKTFDALLKHVSTYVHVPPEAPSAFVVNDLTSAQKNSVFFKGIEPQLNDVILFFPNASVAIVYRPSINKILSYSSIDQSLVQQSQSGTQPEDADLNDVLREGDITQEEILSEHAQDNAL